MVVLNVGREVLTRSIETVSQHESDPVCLNMNPFIAHHSSHQSVTSARAERHAGWCALDVLQRAQVTWQQEN